MVAYKYCQLSTPALGPDRFIEGGIVPSQMHPNIKVHFIYMTLEPCPDKLVWALPRWCPFARASFITIPWGQGRQPAGTGSQTCAGEIARLHHCMANTAMTVLNLPMYASFCCLTCCVQACLVPENYIYIYMYINRQSHEGIVAREQRSCPKLTGHWCCHVNFKWNSELCKELAQDNNKNIRGEQQYEEIIEFFQQIVVLTI